MSLVSLIMFSSAGVLSSLGIRSKSLPLCLVVTFLSSTMYILISGYLLSHLNQIGNITYWGLCSLISFLISVLTILHYRINPYHQTIALIVSSLEKVKATFKKDFLSVLALSFFSVFSLVCVVQILIAYSLPPTNQDSMTYILPRMAQYIQRGNLDFFETNYIAKTVHFKNATILHIYSFLATDRNENIVKLVSLISSWAAILSIYGITRIIWNDRIVAIISALIFAMLTNSILISATPQTDMPITSFISIAVYLFLYFLIKQKFSLLTLSICSMSIAFGIKASSLLLLPSLLIIFLAGISIRYKDFSSKIKRKLFQVTIFSALLASTVFMGNAGYIDNWQKYQNIMGPTEWRNLVTLEQFPLQQRISIGTTNAARYLIHSISFDGMPFRSLLKPIQSGIRWSTAEFFNQFGLEINSKKNTRMPFLIDRLPLPHEDLSYGGIATLLFIVPGVVLACIRFRNNYLIVTLLASGIIYYLAQSFSSFYDPWRGRSFANLGIFFLPMIGSLFMSGAKDRITEPQKKYIFTIGLFSLILFCSALNTTFFRATSPSHLLFQKSAKRTSLQCRSNFRYCHRLNQLEKHLPKNSTILIDNASSTFEYPVYGEKLSRTIYYTGQSYDPKEVDFIISSNRGRKPKPGSILLDPPKHNWKRFENWYLRENSK